MISIDPIILWVFPPVYVVMAYMVTADISVAHMAMA